MQKHLSRSKQISAFNKQGRNQQSLSPRKSLSNIQLRSDYRLDDLSNPSIHLAFFQRGQINYQTSTSTLFIWGPITRNATFTRRAGRFRTFATPLLRVNCSLRSLSRASTRRSLRRYRYVFSRALIAPAPSNIREVTQTRVAIRVLV